MKNYQKILFPCAAAFLLSLSAFQSADADASFESIKNQSAQELALYSAEGSDVASSSVTFNTTRTKFQVEKSSSVSVAETSVVSSLTNVETIDIGSIIKSYK
jgi:hypothetical protein